MSIHAVINPRAGVNVVDTHGNVHNMLYGYEQVAKEIYVCGNSLIHIVLFHAYAMVDDSDSI